MKTMREKEFEVASEAQKILDDAEIVNGVLPGNHDNWISRDTGFRTTCTTSTSGRSVMKP